jgi:hypothetical protein
VTRSDSTDDFGSAVASDVADGSASAGIVSSTGPAAACPASPAGPAPPASFGSALVAESPSGTASASLGERVRSLGSIGVTAVFHEARLRG